jgi:hypothetical protein
MATIGAWLGLMRASAFRITRADFRMGRRGTETVRDSGAVPTRRSRRQGRQIGAARPARVFALGIPPTPNLMMRPWTEVGVPRPPLAPEAVADSASTASELNAL